jgi:serine/threonine protein kinase
MWKVGTEPSAGIAFEKDGGGMWTCQGLLGEGCLGKVFAVVDETGKPAALKMRWPQADLKKNKQAGGALAQLKFELIRYAELVDGNGDQFTGIPRLLQPRKVSERSERVFPVATAWFPVRVLLTAFLCACWQVKNLGDYGEELRYIVIERLGSSVDQLSRPARPEELATIGVQMVRSLEKFHQKGLVHCDLDPQNVCWGYAAGGDDTSDVRIIDLGLVKKIQGRGVEGCQEGKPAYVGSNYFRGEIYSYRDDLESVGLILARLYLYPQSLPWEALRYPQDLRQMITLRAADPSSFLHGSPSADAIANYIREARKLEGGRTPTIDYDALRALLTKCE